MKTALVLSGGGSKGAMQLGFLKYLHEQGLRPDAIYGSSVGALNGAGYAYMGLEKLEEVWFGIKSRSKIFSFNWKTLLFFQSGGIYNSTPLRKSIEKNIVGTPVCDVYVCKVSLITGEIKYGKSGEEDFIDSVVASSSVPGYSEPVGEWADGGIRQQSPLSRAIQDKPDKIVVILCNPLKDLPAYGKVGSIFK